MRTQSIFPSDIKQLFTLEFNQSEQIWHHNTGREPENTNGYKTILKNCDRNTARVIQFSAESYAKDK